MRIKLIDFISAPYMNQILVPNYFTFLLLTCFPMTRRKW